LIYALDLHPTRDLLTILGTFYVSTLTYGSFSIIIATFVIREYMLKQSLQSAIHANQELERIRNIRVSHDQEAGPARVVIQSETSETAEFHLPDLLYIEADDNYATFHWKSDQRLDKKMLRVNLKSIETQLNNAYIIRCHRSFIVNINAITHVRGNTNGYKLNLRDTDLTIPVSRSKGKEVIDKIEQIRNLAESA
jgi:DNA-binding LytR/AlgR family response regulator